MIFSPDVVDLAQRIGSQLRERGDTVAVAEGSAGGLISAALLSIPGASAYFVGATVIYTATASRAWMIGEVEVPTGMRGATEQFAGWLAESVRAKVNTTWGLGEAGAAGPPNPYGDPAGHTWLAVAGPAPTGTLNTSGTSGTSGTVTRNVLTGLDDRSANMAAFTVAALAFFAEVLEAN
jgi:nicotinamide-nucleotide amidase